VHIVVRQTCGLGNQLFQYAAGRCLAKRYGGSLRVAHELPRWQVQNGQPRTVLLPKFAICAPIRKVSYFDRLVLSKRPRLAVAARIARASLKVQVIREAPEQCMSRRDLRIADGTRIAYICGFWQDYSIVREVETELRRELLLLEPASGRNLQVAQRICESENAVSIHLRRGDYALFYGEHMLLSKAYYERAISHVLTRNPRSTFFVFSDDTAFAREWARAHPRTVVVDHNDANLAHEDLRLMSLCRQHIIANSTFSWWGAWLNQRSDKLVIAPTKWLGFDTVKTTIAVPGWTLLDP